MVPTRMRSRLTAAISALIVAAFLCCSLAPAASAATLGGLVSQLLFAQSYLTGTFTETFSDPAGTNLAGTTDASGNVWTVTGGTFDVASGGVAEATTSGLVTATLPSPSVYDEVGGDIHWSGSATFGMLLNADTDGRPATAALYNNSGSGTVTLARISDTGALTTWASVTGTGGGNSPRYLDFRYYQGVYTIKVNSTVVLTYTVPSAQLAAVEAYTGFGIVSDNDTKSSFDDFQGYPL